MKQPIADRDPRYPGTIAERIRDRWHERWQARVLREVLTPPPPSDFGAFGNGSFIVPPARINSPDRIFLGRQVTIHEGTWLAVSQAHADIVPKLTIGDRVRIGRFCHISCVGDIEIGDDVVISDKVLICDAYHGYEDVALRTQQQAMSRPRPVVIGAGVCITIGVLILPGVHIGEGAYIADWSVVSKSVPPHTVVGGNPAMIRDSLELGPHTSSAP